MLVGVLKEHQRRQGRVLEPWNNIRRDLAIACEKAGLDRVTPNDLRRTFASWLKQAGVDSFTVGKLMGHTSSRMVELVYGHLNDVTFINAVKQLPALPEPQNPGSKWVAMRSGFPETSETHETRTSLEHQVLRVPKDGVEPPTRGFSIPLGSQIPLGESSEGEFLVPQVCRAQATSSRLHRAASADCRSFCAGRGRPSGRWSPSMTA
jgi:Phage integrase family